MHINSTHSHFLDSPNCRFGGRLLSIKENHKFRRQENGVPSSLPRDLKEFVSDIKETFKLKYASENLSHNALYISA